MNRVDLALPPATRHPEPVIETQGLTRYFGGKAALLDMTIRVPRGSVFAFLGRNGAGKSTAIRMMLGLLEPTRGRATILGHDSSALPSEVRARIGYMAENHPVFAWMRAGQCGRFQSTFYSHWNQDLFAAVLDYFSIDPRTKAGHLYRLTLRRRVNDLSRLLHRNMMGLQPPTHLLPVATVPTCHIFTVESSRSS
jgi:ABC-2 type transport system ATP-binding protein